MLLKVIHPQWAGDAELIERFDREGKAIAKISHPNVVRVFDSGWEEGLPYLALEWIDGGTLEEKMAEGPLPQDQVKRLARELLDGLTAVHEAALIHRDIKPSNVMIGSDGSARLTDFSLAGLIEHSTLTGHNALVGSPAYIAPELLTGAAPDLRSDLYGVGVTLYQALTGSNPFDAGDPFASLERVRKGSAPKLKASPRVDPQLADLIDRLMDPDPELRPRTATEALIRLQGKGPRPSVETVPPPATSAPPVSRRRRLIAALAASVAAVAIVAIWIGLRKHEAESPDPASTGTVTVEPPESEIVQGAGEPAALPATREQQRSDSPERTVGEETPAGEVEAAPPAPAELMVIVSPWGEVWVDGTSRGTTPLGALSLPSGERSIEIRHPTLPGLSRRIELEPGSGETLRVDLRAEAAAISVSCEPWGYLWLDGDSIGLLPRDAPIWLAPGEHTISIRNPSLPIREERLILAAGERLSLRINLKSGAKVATPEIR